MQNVHDLLDEITATLDQGIAMAEGSTNDMDAIDTETTTITAMMFSPRSRALISAYVHNPNAISEATNFDPDRPDCDIDESFNLRALVATYYRAGFLAGSSKRPFVAG